MKKAMFVLLTVGFGGGGLCDAQEKKDRHGEDLTEKVFSSEPLNGANFSDCTLTNAKFRDASLKNASFKGAILKGTEFNNADMTGADMSGLKGEFGPTFDGTNLSKSNWEGSDVLGARKSNFSGANFKKAKFGRFYFFNCDFRGADLRGANLRAAAEGRLDHCLWKGAKYDEDTAFPDDIDPKAEGMILSKSDPKIEDKK